MREINKFEFEEIVNMLRLFSALRRYSFIDRIGNALNYETVEFALWDAIRTFKSMFDSARVETKNDKQIRYVEENSEKIYLPKIPSETQVSEFLNNVREDIGVARRIAIKALSFPQWEKE